MPPDRKSREERIICVNALSQPDESDKGWPSFEPVKWVASAVPPRGSAARQELLQEGLEIVPRSFGESHIYCRREFQRRRIVPRGTS